MRPGLRGLAALALLALAGGCATTTAPAGGGAAPAVAATNPVDPWENLNRKIFDFNEQLDDALLKPVAGTYRRVVPSLVRTGIDNFLGNIYDAWSTANHFLQGKVDTGLQMGMRVLMNSFVGLGGILDPATEMRLVKRSEDFGQTMGRWGVPVGPYVVLPLIGPSSVRDTAGFLVDRQFSPASLPESTAASYGVATLEVINIRSNLLATGNLVDQVALDKYSFYRDAYLARRRDALYDGAPPMETFDDIDPGPSDAAPAKPAPAASTASAASVAASAAAK